MPARKKTCSKKTYHGKRIYKKIKVARSTRSRAHERCQRKLTAWMVVLGEVYKAGKKLHRNYSYRDAMQHAKFIYDDWANEHAHRDGTIKMPTSADLAAIRRMIRDY
jgi:hypothetical protein